MQETVCVCVYQCDQSAEEFVNGMCFYGANDTYITK